MGGADGEEESHERGGEGCFYTAGVRSVAGRAIKVKNGT